MASLLLGQGALQSFVVCRGLDGHVAVEVARTRNTCEWATPELPTEIDMLEGPSITGISYGHCGSCRDRAVANADTFVIQPPAPDVPKALLADNAFYRELLPLLQVVVVQDASARLIGPVPARSPVLRALRSTVLRT